jgi:hypothetical protein
VEREVSWIARELLAEVDDGEERVLGARGSLVISRAGGHN